MNICVCGWYGRQFDEFYMALYKAKKKHNVTVIAKKDESFWDEMAMPYSLMDNIGLEWGAYDYFLRHCWQEGSTLFTHDDVVLGHVIRDNATISQEGIFDLIANLDCDQAYIFSSRAEDVFNNGHHGRALFISDRLMKWLKPQGIWFDAENTGNTDNGRYNDGTKKFKWQMEQAKKEGFDTLRKVYMPVYQSAHRGQIKNWEELL